MEDYQDDQGQGGYEGGDQYQTQGEYQVPGEYVEQGGYEAQEEYQGQVEYGGQGEYEAQGEYVSQGEYQDSGDYQDNEYYQGQDYYPEGEEELPTDDPRIAASLMIATYVIGGIGVALGFYGYFSSGAYRGLHLAFPLMVGAVGIISFIRHSIFHRSDAINIGEDPDDDAFFQIEVGFANLAVGIVALIVFFGSWGQAAEAAITFVYAIYLTCAACVSWYRHFQYDDIGRSVILHHVYWLVWVGFMFFFAVAAAASTELAPF